MRERERERESEREREEWEEKERGNIMYICCVEKAGQWGRMDCVCVCVCVCRWVGGLYKSSKSSQVSQVYFFFIFFIPNSIFHSEKSQQCFMTADDINQMDAGETDN